MNGWFPKIRYDGTIASGNNGIWLTTPQGVSTQISATGTLPTWISKRTLVYNADQTRIGNAYIPIGYNSFNGSDNGWWTGFYSVGAGRLDRYNGPDLIDCRMSGCNGKFMTDSYGYLSPYQSIDRSLVLNDKIVITKKIIDWYPWDTGYIYSVATGTYTKEIIDNKGNNVTIRSQQDEMPILAFMGPDVLPYMVSYIGDNICIRMIYTAFGYKLPEVLLNPDARMFDGKLRVVGSTNAGAPLFDNWIDFSKPKIDLRLL